MVSHVGQDHGVLEHGEDAVHARLAVHVVSPVAVHRRQDAAEVGHQQLSLVSQRLSVH